MLNTKHNRPDLIQDTLRKAYNRKSETYEAFIWYDLVDSKKLKGYELIKTYEQVLSEYVNQDIDKIYYK
jgi:hypothetical protein